MAPTPVWWKEATIYQIYPASFRDSNGDGWGDLNGIISKLDYIRELGADVIWLSPVYKSPKVDMGYDISDYEAIDPLYGSLDDVERLVQELKRRDMKLMMDLVVNHTSDQHAWFRDSKSSKYSAKRDYYIWRKAKFDNTGRRLPPNNWASILGGGNNSAWTWDDTTGEYYLSLFNPTQPDLNWENPKVRESVFNILRFWLDRGICGFRMDVINLISKDQNFPDAPMTAPSDLYQSGSEFYANGPRMHEYLQELKTEVLAHYDTVTVGEMPHVGDEDEILRTVGAYNGELNMIFIFDIVDIDGSPTGDAKAIVPWDANTLKRIINRWQRVMFDRGGWNAIFGENHDTPRSLSRYCDDSDEYRILGAKLLCLLWITLSGTLYLFQGQELGLRNMPASWGIEEYADISSRKFWEKTSTMFSDDASKLAEARRILQRKARDNTRLPMPWTSESPNAGFCPPTVMPWMRVNDDYQEFNADSQTRGSGASVYGFWKRALAFRKENKILIYGDFALLEEEDERLIAYQRFADSETFIVVLNFSGQSKTWTVPSFVTVSEWIVTNYGDWTLCDLQGSSLQLRPWEALIGRC
ncbi:MAG: hypothetical protein M1822_000818 [Bathelium mastoideum]|nr:MAG: hypothetical protein M1822_000818 [Bathelium mastoideum]